MARADLLVQLVRAGNQNNQPLFKKVVNSLIAEERSKHHHILAKQLEDSLHIHSNQSKGYFINFNDEKLEDLLYHYNPGKTLDDMVLKKEVLGILREFIEEHNRRDLLRSYNLEPRNRILLIGEPGNGKTSLAEAIAEALQVPFFVIRYDGIIGSYLGETASRLKRMFEFIKSRECVLFLDEFDTIGKERGDEHETGEIKRVVSSLLLQIDDLPGYVTSIAATNHPELLDRAVWRRFQIRLELNKPDKKMIKEYLQGFQERMGENLNYSLDTLADKLQGINFSEVEDFCLDIQRKYVLSLPEVNLKTIVNRCLEDMSIKYRR